MGRTKRTFFLVFGLVVLVAAPMVVYIIKFDDPIMPYFGVVFVEAMAFFMIFFFGYHTSPSRQTHGIDHEAG